ncbi:MAG: hypothetical protein C5B50_10730 [Verrucomicrobia bacterium]|nr:MAG: hypothetical protein C5B50_10730 [Verrucomicrobiota bacterium]
MPNGYGELNWNGFFVLNGLDVPPSYGYNAGVVSPSNVVFNIYGGSASFSATSGPFGLNSAYLTAALNLDTPLNIEALGYLGTTLLYSNVYTVYRTAPTFVNFNYSGITQAIFVSSPAQQFAMDNLTITVPEPEPMLLLVYGVGVMVRWSVLRGGRSGKRGLARRWMTGEDR